MAQKLIPWNTGGGNIVVNYSGSGNDTVTVGSDTDNTAFTPRSQSITVRTTAGASISSTVTVTQSGKVVPVGTIYNFAYTGTVQEVTLSAGTYKLQVWGAQGGQNPAYPTYGIVSVDGGKGGYSEGILTLTSPTTLYIFVGGQPSTSSTNGGWNGGGGGTGTSTAGTPTTATYGLGYTTVGRGGGATDIALTTSTMSYSSYRTNRSAASLLSRFIVAGGGSGGAMAYQEITTSTTSWQTVGTVDMSGSSGTTGTFDGKTYTIATVKSGSTYIKRATFVAGVDLFSPGDVLRATVNGTFNLMHILWTGTDDYMCRNVSSTPVTFDYIPCPDEHAFRIQINTSSAYFTSSVTIEKQVTTTSTTTDTASQIGYVGGGIEGGYGTSSVKATQSAAGNRAGYGYGANQFETAYRYPGAYGGGGWYGGGTNYGNATSSMTSIKFSGGGSGFVNISANSSYRPTGYTGIELDSGATYAGDTSFPSTSGSTETGHSGDGYARITCVDPNAIIPLTFDILGDGTIGWKASNSSLTKTIQYKKNNGSWTSITSTTSGVTISVANGDVVQFKGDNTAYGNSSYYNTFTATCNFTIRGNIMSLINSSTFSTLTNFTANYALRGLFYSNTYLQSAENLILPSGTYQRCYQAMFRECTGLTKASLLPAATLATYAYHNMFYGCSSLTYIKCLATNISASNCTSNWVYGVAESGTFVKASTMNSWTTGNNGIPSGWTVQNATS